MPDYFFHVAIELNTNPGVENISQGLPKLSPFFQALKPFSNQTGRRTSRDVSFDKNRGEVNHRRELPQTKEQNNPDANPPPSSLTDHRFDQITIESADMESSCDTKPTKASATMKDNIVGKGIGSALSTHYMKGHYQAVSHPDSPAVTTTNDHAWGIVHLYRDAEETPGLYKPSPLHSSDLWSDNPTRKTMSKPYPPPKDEDCTSLCILAVPSYMTPAEFLAFVGEDTRNDVSHFRMVRTERANRYMVLMKFRNGKRAREWQYEWNGKIFNAMEPESCHVVFLKSVELVQTALPTPPNENSSTAHANDDQDHNTSYPRMTNDPFISTTSTHRPLPPRTPSLVELPTCPVCLERMDETTGLLTIPCQHVFHCTCLQKWSGGGCPVCRYTHDDFSSRLGGHKQKKKVLQGSTGEYEIRDDEELECETCHANISLWQCLICGKIGCGRYEGKHAYRHFEETAHTFAMDLESKRVWDYVGDSYVHRIIQDSGSGGGNGAGEKLVELPGRNGGGVLDGRDEDEKEARQMENLAVEYTHLLTSQLESQRVYFEGVLERAVDKASESARRAEWAVGEMDGLKVRLAKVEEENDVVFKGKVGQVEREKERLDIRARKLEEMLKDVKSKYLDERESSRGLMERVKFLEETRIRELSDKIRGLEEESATKDLLMEGLREEHRDAMVQVSVERQLREMVVRGDISNEELEGAEVTVGKKPLTARERLRERLVAEREVRGGSKKEKGEKKGKEELSLAPEKIADSPGHAERKTMQDVLWLLDMNTLREGDAWDFQKARDMLDEMKGKMLELGLLQTQAEGSETQSSQLGSTSTATKKGKGKAKGKGGK